MIFVLNSIQDLADSRHINKNDMKSNISLNEKRSGARSLKIKFALLATKNLNFGQILLNTNKLVKRRKKTYFKQMRQTKAKILLTGFLQNKYKR